MYSGSKVKAVSKKQQVNFRIDTNLLEALKQQAEIEGTSYTDLIQRLCWQGLNGFNSSSTIQSAIRGSANTVQSSDNVDSTIQPAIQPDILKEQLKAELREELADSINDLVKVNLDEISKKLTA